MTRNPRIDPRPGDRIEHPDGGTLWVLGRHPKTVLTKRGAVSENAAWMRLSTFQRLVARQRVLSVQHKVEEAHWRVVRRELRKR